MMAAMPVVHLDKPFAGVHVLGNAPGAGQPAAATSAGYPDEAAPTAALMQEIEQHKRTYENLCTALACAAERLDQLYDDIFAGHSEAVARLSVEIARKVLMRNIEDGDYKIESIIREAMKNTPDNTRLVVRLNPADLDAFRQLQDSGQTALSGFDLQADPALGRAECVIDSAKGTIQLLIDEHLDRISKALTKAG